MTEVTDLDECPAIRNQPRHEPNGFGSFYANTKCPNGRLTSSILNAYTVTRMDVENQ